MKPAINKPAVGEGMVYFMVWTLITLVPILNSQMMSEEHIYMVNILTAWSKIFPYFIIFLVNNFWLLPKLLLRKRVLLYFSISIAMLASIFYPIEYFQESLRYLPYASGDMYVVHGRASFTDLAWYWNILLGLLMMGANAGIKMVFNAIQNEQKMIALESQSLKTEMDYLKYQINPHFFMNTLNNIHAMIDIDPEAAKGIVIELSKMMRYVLYDSEQDSISLDKEIQFLQHYIQLMRLRYSDSVEIVVDVPENSPLQVKIPPLIFIVFVENAFKHGISYNSRSYIHTSLRNFHDPT